jgi:hypothetical protein
VLWAQLLYAVLPQFLTYLVYKLMLNLILLVLEVASSDDCIAPSFEDIKLLYLRLNMDLFVAVRERKEQLADMVDIALDTQALVGWEYTPLERLLVLGLLKIARLIR